MNIHFFFRKKSENKHSIELLFKAIQENLPQNINIFNKYSLFYSQGIFRRFFSALYATFQQGEINHITGDIHFFTIFMKKSKTILTIHDVEILKRTKGLKHKILKFFWFTLPISRAQKITVISDFSKQELLHYLPQIEHKITVIPNCIHAIYKAQIHKFNSEKPKILQIGTKQNKNLERVALALKTINCKLIILGKLTEKQDKVLKENKIDFENHIHLSLEQVYQIYIHSDILLFASTYEGFGLPILEAQAVGRPVICSNVASMPYVAGNSAYFVNPYSIEEIRNATKEVIKNKTIREDLVKKGFENVKRFSAQNVAMQYAKIYTELNS